MRIEWRTDNPPEEREQYLVTYEGGGMDICAWTNENRFWSDMTADWHWNARPYCRVAAWMPLPNEYEQEVEE